MLAVGQFMRTIIVVGFQEIGNRGTQSVAQAMDKNGNLFFGMLNPLALACWVSQSVSCGSTFVSSLILALLRSNFQDSRTDYTKQNIKIVAQNDETLQFITGLKILTNGNGEEELWMISNRFQVRSHSLSLSEAPSSVAHADDVYVYFCRK